MENETLQENNIKNEQSTENEIYQKNNNKFALQKQTKTFNKVTMSFISTIFKYYLKIFIFTY